MKVCPVAQVHTESHRASSCDTAGTTNTGSAQRGGGVFWLPCSHWHKLCSFITFTNILNIVQYESIQNSNSEFQTFIGLSCVITSNHQARRNNEGNLLEFLPNSLKLVLNSVLQLNLRIFFRETLTENFSRDGKCMTNSRFVGENNYIISCLNLSIKAKCRKLLYLYL